MNAEECETKMHLAWSREDQKETIALIQQCVDDQTAELRAEVSSLRQQRDLARQMEPDIVKMAELQAIVDKLPKTADGTFITDWFAPLWFTYKSPSGIMIAETTWDEWQGCYEDHDWWMNVYSTSEAAEAAKVDK